MKERTININFLLISFLFGITRGRTMFAPTRNDINFDLFVRHVSFYKQNDINYVLIWNSQ